MQADKIAINMIRPMGEYRSMAVVNKGRSFKITSKKRGYGKSIDIKNE